MAKQTIEQWVCDGVNGRACGKTLALPSDGLVIRGAVSLPGSEAPVVGPTPNVRNGGAAETALCWACWHRAVSDPLLAEARRAEAAYSEELYRDK